MIISLECPKCKSHRRPRCVGQFQWWFAELFVFECKECHQKGFLGEFAKRNNQISILH